MKNVALAYKAGIFLNEISEGHWSKPLSWKQLKTSPLE